MNFHTMKFLVMLLLPAAVIGFGPMSYAACVTAGMAACAAGATAGAAATAGVGAAVAVASFGVCEQAVIAACIPTAACFSENTRVYVSKNETEAITNLKKGDVVMTRDILSRQLLTTRVIANVAIRGDFSFVDVGLLRSNNKEAIMSSLSVTEDHVVITNEDRHLPARNITPGLMLFPDVQVASLTRSNQNVKHVLITSGGSVLIGGDVVVSTTCEGSLDVNSKFSEAVVKWQKVHSHHELLLPAKFHRNDLKNSHLSVDVEDPIVF